MSPARLRLRLRLRRRRGHRRSRRALPDDNERAVGEVEGQQHARADRVVQVLKRDEDRHQSAHGAAEENVFE